MHTLPNPSSLGLINKQQTYFTPVKQPFLPRNARHSIVLVILNLSVHLLVTLVNCAHMVRHTIMISSPYMAAL